MTEKRTDPN